jgi:mannose-6-phosphate isomerase-like protein (cupin superfamily)
MIKAGFHTTEPRTGTRTLVLKGTAETDGMGWVIEVTCPEGAPPSILEHVHTEWLETFEIVEGNARYKLNGRELGASKGDVIVMPAGQPHIHPWNAGVGPMVYRQTNEFARRSPEAVDDVLGVFASLNGLTHEGKVGGRGLPKNPLQFAATLRTLVKHEGFDAAVPIFLQRFLSATLGRLAEALGYRAVYPRFVGDSKS